MRSAPAAKSAPEAPKEYGEGSLDYDAYLRVDELVRLQTPQSKPAHHDELLFIIIHQAFELWFKLVVHEMESAIEAMKKGQVERAHHFVSRVVEVVRLFVPQIHLLETMAPIEFLKFRDHLKPASGFQSLQFREIEFLAGIKDDAYVRYFKHRPQKQKRLKQRLSGPDLPTAYLELLRHVGLAVPRADPRTDPEAARTLIRALLPIYGAPEDHFALYQLTEKLLEFDEAFALWRQHHVNVVERIIGLKQGTGGSSGASYLRTTTGKRAFPFLWDLRTSLELNGGETA